MTFCEKCGKQFPENVRMCTDCGAPTTVIEPNVTPDAEPAANTPPRVPVAVPDAATPKHGKPGRRVAPIVGAVAVVAALVVAFHLWGLPLLRQENAPSADGGTATTGNDQVAGANQSFLEVIASHGDNVLYNLYADQDAKDQHEDCITMLQWNGKVQRLWDRIAVVRYNEDLSTILFKQDEALYLIREGGEPQKLTENVSNITEVKADGTLFWYSAHVGTEKLAYSDLLVDDVAEADAALVAPQPPVKPVRDDYDEETAYTAAMKTYDEQYAQYNADYGAYSVENYAKAKRDTIREKLRQGATCNLNRYTWYRYANGTVTALVSGYNAGTSDDLVGNSRLIVYQTPEEALAKIASFSVRISDVEDWDDLQSRTWEWVSSFSTLCLIDGDRVLTLEDGAFDAELSDDEQTVYYRKAANANDTVGTRYCVTVTDNGLSTPKKVK